MTTDRRLYDMDLGRRDHTRWLGSSGRYSTRLTLPTTNLLAAYDARVGVTNVSGACSAWADQSGNGFHATQGTAGNRPTISTADGFPSLLFDGTNDRLITPAITAITGVKTIYAVTKLTSLPGSYVSVFGLASTIIGTAADGKYGMYEAGSYSSGIAPTTSRTRLEYEILYAASTARTRVNGTAGPSHAWSSGGAIAAGNIGAAFGGASYLWPGHILFLGIYGAARNTSVVDYIAQEWGV